MRDYTIFYKHTWHADKWPSSIPTWEVFLSAFNGSERVQKVFDQINASRKYWVLCPEYHYAGDEGPTAGSCIRPGPGNEAHVVSACLDEIGDVSSICVDITGFMRPQILFLMRALWQRGIHKFDVLYSEPTHYVRDERTRFSDQIVVEVRQVAGFEGSHSIDTSKDVVVIGAGYENKLIAHIAEHKSGAQKIRLLGLPSLRADMYQQNVLQAELASEQVGSSLDGVETHFAPANDPFVTADVLSKLTRTLYERGALTNLYLTSLATKVQTLGFGLFYLYECIGQPSSIIFPRCENYHRETSKGISRVWRYEIELPPTVT